MISFICDEGGDVSGSIFIQTERQDYGSYEGELNYVASPDVTDYQINSKSIVRAHRVGDCNDSRGSYTYIDTENKRDRIFDTTLFLDKISDSCE